MIISGFHKQSLIDYPGKFASVVFTTGCNFRCGYCHNHTLVDLTDIKAYDLDEIFSYLKKNKLLDAIVVTGGEPCIQKDLVSFISKIKELGLLVKLDTNGTKPEVVKELLDKKLIDFIAMDIKNSLDYESYKKVVGNHLTEKMFSNVLDTFELIKNSVIDYEFRTTVVKELHSMEDFIKISEKLKGVNKYSLQKFNNSEVLDKSFEKYSSYSDEEFKEIVSILEKNIRKVSVR